MPTRPRNARKSKNAHAKLSSGPSSSVPSSADASASQTPLSPPLQLPTPLPEPQERIRATLARVDGVGAGRGGGGVVDMERGAGGGGEGEGEGEGGLAIWGNEEEEEGERFVPPPTLPRDPYGYGYGREGGEEDGDGDVLGHLIDFGSLPSSPPPPPQRLASVSPLGPQHPLPLPRLPVESQQGEQQGDVSLSGFLNDRGEGTNPFGGPATYEAHAANPFGAPTTATTTSFQQETPFDAQAAYRPESFDVQATVQPTTHDDPQPQSQPQLELDGEEEAVYKSPPFMQVGLPEVEEGTSVPVRQEVEDEERGLGLGLGIPRRGEAGGGGRGGDGEGEGGGREGGVGHVRAPTVVVASRSSPSSAPSSHARSLSSASTSTTASSSINPPSLTLDLSPSSSGSAFGSLSKTIRGYAPSLPMGITSPGGLGKGGVGKKSAPYPPLVSRPVVAGRVESGRGAEGGGYSGYYGGIGGGGYGGGGGGGGGTVRSPYEQEFEREYERDWEDEGRAGAPFSYGYSKSPPATVEAFVPPLSRGSVASTTTSRAPTSSSASSRVPSTTSSRVPTTTSTTSRTTTSRTASTVPVPDRQRAWPEYASSSPAQAAPSTAVSRHRATRSQGSQATLASGLASGLTQTLRGGGGVDPSSGASTPSKLTARVRVEVEGEGDDAIERVVWARWDTLEKRQVLIIGYERGVQVWDAGRLGSVAEVLNVNFDADEGRDSGGKRRQEKGGKEREGWTEKGERVKSVVKGVVVPAKAEIVLLLETQEPAGDVGSTLVLYSVREDRVVSRWRGEGVPVDVECGRGVVVVSTASPPALHTLSPTLGILYTIPSLSLALYSTPRVTSSNSQLSLAIPSSISPSNTFGSAHTLHGDAIEGREVTSAAHRAELPHPVYAVHGRLLAYAIPSSSSTTSLRRKDSSLSSSSGGSGPSPSSITSGSPLASALTGLSAGQGLGLGSGIAGIPNTKAELGSAALKVGSGLIGGMRFLGGMALEGVKSRMSASPSPSATSQRSGASSSPGNPVSMFSRSAPTNESAVVTSAEEEKKRRRFSDIQHHGVLAQFTSSRNVASQGYMIRVVDLASISAGSAKLDSTIKDAKEEGEGKKLRVVAEFVGSRSQPVAKLDFTPDGCGVYVVPRDGFVTKVFHLLPATPSPSSSSTSNAPSSTSTTGNDVKTGSVLPLYEFRRGRMKTAVVESVKGVPDGRWAGVVTRNRTVHVFAPNPLGGKAHIPSHLDGRMRQGAPVAPTTARTTQGDPKAVELKPIVRLSGERLVQGWSTENPPPSMAFTFVDQSTSLPPSLAPTFASHHHRPSTSASSNAPSSPPAGLSLSASPGSPLSPRANKAPKNYQDVLLFDSATGMLYLQRITAESRLKNDSFVGGLGGGAVGGLVNAAINVSSSLGAKSISAASLPGGGAGPLGITGNASVASSSVSSHSGVAVPRAYGKQAGGGGDEGYELVGHANVIAHWDLRKRRGWEEIRGKVGGSVEKERVGGAGAAGPDESLAQAELSTFSKSRSQRSRPIYLTHQFAFHTLGEDYHALIRKYRLDVHGSKIDVRRDIPIHAFGASTQGGPSSESFVEGFSPTRSSHPSHHLGGGVPSSFDEPLASALSGEMEYAPSSNVLPMYPNGPGGGMGGAGRSLRNSIPIRKIGDGVSGGLGRIRKAVPSAVRSPRLGPSRSGGSGVDDVGDVLLEFDEEVDDFMAPRIVAPAQGGVGSSAGMDDDVVGTVDEEIWGDSGWDSQDRMAIEEEEQFHAISGTLSPQFEQEVMLPPPTAPSSMAIAGGVKAKKSKKSRK